MKDFDLEEPESLAEALALLDEDDSAVRPIGGGTALMLMMKAQFFEPTRLVSLRKVGGALGGIDLSEDGSSLRVGAGTTFTELQQSPLVQKHLPVIGRVMKTLANVRVRNVATIGGNLAHGDPHLDLPPVWMALDSAVDVVGPSGERRLAVADLFQGYYETSLADGEVITALHAPLVADRRAAYAKVTTRASHDWPALGVAISLVPDGDVITDIRIVLGAALDMPTRLTAAESVLRGQLVDDELLASAGETAAKEVDIESDHRGSADYKNHLLKIYLGRVVRELMGR